MAEQQKNAGAGFYLLTMVLGAIGGVAIVQAQPGDPSTSEVVVAAIAGAFLAPIVVTFALGFALLAVIIMGIYVMAGGHLT